MFLLFSYSYIYDSQDSKYLHSFYVCHPFASQENQNNLNQTNDKENDPKVQVDGKLVGEINPDNFTYESDFMPKVKKEIKQENSEDHSLLATNAQSPNEPFNSKDQYLPLREDPNYAKKVFKSATKPISDGFDKDLEYFGNFRVKLGPKTYRCPFCYRNMSGPSYLKIHINAKHIGENPFSCKDCGKTFNQRSSLDDHLYRFH